MYTEANQSHNSNLFIHITDIGVSNFCKSIMKKNIFKLATLTLFLFYFVDTAAAESPLSQQLSLKFSNSQLKVTLPELDLDGLRSKALNGSAEKALEFAQENDYQLNVKELGGWSNLQYEGSEMSVWRLEIESPNAYSINFGFSDYFMPAGGKLFIYADGYKNVVGPFTDKDNEVHNELWTPIIPGRKVFVEVNIPTNLIEEMRLELSKVNQAYLDVTKLSEEFNTLKSGSCNVDVVCPQGNGWRNQIQSVAAYSTGGSLFCTGAAINNAKGDKRPYFLTANHCGINSSNAPSVVAYWNFQNSTCRAAGSFASGASGNGVLSQFNTGAIFRASYAPSDMTLIEFDDPVLSSANVYFSGWSRANSTFSSAVAIHHPNVDEKRISFENDPVTISGYLGNTGTGSTHIRVADWDLGTTEPGSSGSPLFNANRQIIGQLHGGFAACGNNDEDWYGRIHVSWTGGGSSSSRLSNWLDPDNSGAVAINGLSASAVIPSGPGPENEPDVPLQGVYLILEDD